MSNLDDLLMTAPSAEERIVEIAKAMREAYHLAINGEDMSNILPWDDDYVEEREAWVAAAAVARADLCSFSVDETHWLAPLFGPKGTARRCPYGHECKDEPGGCFPDLCGWR